MFIKIEQRRIKADNIAAYGLDDNGDSYIVYCHGGSTVYAGPDFTLALDAALGIKSARTNLPDDLKKKIEARIAMTEAMKQGIEDIQ